MTYLKTTDTCNLNCSHCFTNGANGKKGWFDVDGTVNFFERLHELVPTLESGNISFHGGEPMICPTEKIFDAWNGIKNLWPNVWWSVQTNLTFPLTEKKVSVFEQICNKSWGTSWDKGIRWPNEKLEKLWADNVKTLSQDGHEITLMVSLGSNVINNMEPIDIINGAAELGIKYINFERITPNGNALQNNSLLPDNKVQDEWFLRMWHQCVENKTYEYIENMFFNSILTELVHKTHTGCRCRECEQKILTINADGTIGGCPNSAVENTFGTIYDDVEKVMLSPGRMCNIQSEIVRNPLCMICPVYEICNGDCHQLQWQGNVCAAPKSLMIHLSQNRDEELFKKFLNGFMGQE